MIKGITVKSYTHHTTTAISAMEYIYFARPDSTIAGKNVHAQCVRLQALLFRNSGKS